MTIETKTIKGNNLTWILRCPTEHDAAELSALRVTIDGETEFLDREEGEDFIGPEGFIRIIAEDLLSDASLFLIAETEGKIIGYSRCVGNKLNRFKHKAEFGICISKEYWGHGIGKVLLETIINWADNKEIEKLTLTVVQTNTKAISLYKKYGFTQEGLLVKDRIHKDGNYYNTMIMGRFRCDGIDEEDLYR
ncbi:MAG TPA: GNAT family N-acetyltransferase [Mobilitalea sp.]|nr:GNAT family N-acetyltransferase [Mobilitalea sp.]